MGAALSIGEVSIFIRGGDEQKPAKKTLLRLQGSGAADKSSVWDGSVEKAANQRGFLQRLVLS